MHEQAEAIAADCDGVLLSGGRGDRVGGRDKGLMPVGDSIAASRGLALMQPLCRRLFVSANRNLDRYRALGDVTVVSDLRADFPGPLAALEALTRYPLAPLLLVLPNDLPTLRQSVLQTLLEHMRGANATLDGVFATDGEHPQYLCACLRRNCLDNVGAQLDAGQHRVYGWLNSWNVTPLLFEGHEAGSLRNFNSNAQWARLR